MEFEKNIAIVDERKTLYLEKSHEQKNAIIFLHGFPGSHNGIVEMADKVTGRRIIVPDLPGCGESEPFDIKHVLKTYAKWLNDFLDSLSINKVVVVGHSFGARVALMFSVYYPEKIDKLILITPVSKADNLVARLGSLNYKLAGFLPYKIQKKWLFNPVYRKGEEVFVYNSSDPEVRQKLIKLNDEEIKMVDTVANAEIFEELRSGESIIKGDKINVKTLIIGCGKDKIASLASIKDLRNRFVNSEIVTMKNSGHLVVAEEPKVVANIINKWLKK